MKKRIKKIISLFLAAVLLTASVNAPPVIKAAMAAGEEAVAEAEFTTAKATESTAARATESSADVATPSEASPSEAKESFIRIKAKDIPSWYKKAGNFYQFTDRDGITQYRIYGKIGKEGDAGWYQSDETGALLEDLTIAQPVDLDWEDNYDAPYRFESALASRSVFKELSETLFYDEDAIFEYTSEITVKEPFGQNYDGTCYDVWHIYSNSETEDEELQEDLDIYYMYGHIVNTYSSDLSQDKWFEVSEDGEVIVKETVSIPFLFTSLLMAVMPQTYSLPGNMEVYVRSWSEGPDRSNLKYTSTDFYKNWSSNIKSSENSTKQINGLILSSFSSGYKSETVTYTQKNNDFICFYLINHGESASGRGTAEGNMRLYAPDGTLVYEATRSEGIYGVFIMVYLDGSANGQWRIETDSYSYYSESEETKEGWEDVWGGVKYINISGLSYTVNYNGNGATGGSTGSSSHTNGTASPLTSNGYTRTYYSFKNWNTKADGSGTSYSNGQSVSSMDLDFTSGGTVTLYAQWTRTSSVVTFKDWNGTVLKTQEVSNGASASPPSNPSRTGYTFTGWDKAYTNITDHTTVTAKYAANTYTIAYHGNEATGGSTASSTHSYDTAKTLTANGFTRTYYTFKNWNTKADGSGTSYSNSQSVSNLTAAQGATVVLYAQWTRSSSLVTFKNWDESTLKTQEVANGASATPPSSPARTGYTFTGWDKPYTNITDHTIVTAQYSINSYTLTLNGNGGSADGSLSKTESVTYQDSFDQQLRAGRDVFLRTGYTFDRWYSEESGGSAYSYNGNVMPAAAVTVYAHWIPNTYAVRFDPDHIRWTGGIFQEEHIFDTKLGTLPAPEIYGWEFLGWRTGQNGAGEAVTEQSGVESQNVTYYGSWEPGTYQIRYLSEAEHPSGRSVQTFTADQVYDAALGTLPQPEEPGYTFTGWYDGSEKVTPETVFSPVSDAEGHTYHARWEANTYHIRLLGNHYGLDQVISEFDRNYYTRIGGLPEPEVPGYTFLGWFDETGNEITAESWVEFQNADYLAHWQVNQYTVSFDKNLYAVEENPKDKKVTYDEVLGELPVLSADGYTFLGWYTDPEEGEKVKEETPVEIGDQTYYAHWNQNYYVLKLITDKALSLINELTVIYDRVLGALPVPELEDFSFRGWYLKSYSDTAATPSEAKYQESIYLDTATPSEALRIDENTVYQTATSSEAYAYFDLVYQEEEGNKNRRSGIDGILGTEDDNFYFNGQDQTAGTTDDRKINRGTDGTYGTTDDYYELDGGCVYPGPDGIFGTPDDYLDLFNGTNLRPQDALWWNDTGTLLVNNGYDGKPGTRDDWIWESKIRNTIRRSGPDGIFYTEDDEIWWIGADGIPGTEDDQLNHKGLDSKYGTADDFIDNEDGTNTRAGTDGIWGTEDDELWWNGPDGIPGTEDDQLIHKGMDDKYGTSDDFIDNEDGTNTRPGPDGIWGTDYDELWWNGPDGIPGTADDQLIHKGMDGKYGTSDDFIDNEDGTNTRPGSDGIWGTEDDELWWNGPDGIPGTADDQLIHKGMDGKYGTADDFIDNEDGTNTRAGADGIWGTEDDELWMNGPDGIPGNEDDYLYKVQDDTETAALKLGSDDDDEDDGWVYDSSKNVWAYYYFSDKNIISSWAYLIYNGVKEWYYFDENGTMMTGWYEDLEGKKYYLHEISDGTKGRMYRGWNEINGNWYYFNESDGSLVTGTVTPDGYEVDETGARIN